MFRNKFLTNLVLCYENRRLIIPKTTSNFSPRPDKPRIFFIEYGHDGYHENSLSIQILKKSSYLSDKMHIKKVSGKNVMKCYGSGIRNPDLGARKMKKNVLFVNF
jgi:hypothetical protein